MRNSSSRTAVKAANRLLVTPPRRSFAALRMITESSRQTLHCARGTELLRGVYPERSEWAQDDSQDTAQSPHTGSLLSKRLGILSKCPCPMGTFCELWRLYIY